MNTKVLSTCATTVLLTLLILLSGWRSATRAATIQANTWHVATNGSDTTGNGSSNRPFATIQHGIGVASHGDTVLVHPGVYREDANFNGKNITVGSLSDMGTYENPSGPPLPSAFTIYLSFVVQSAPSEPPLDVTPGVALQTPRAEHTATRLADGRILLVAGSQGGGGGQADVEIFDPAAGQTSRAAPLRTAQHNHTATLLPDGRVLVVGGYSEGWLNDAEVYNPSTDTWTAVPPRYSHGIYSTATLMKDGRVLVVGGGIGSCHVTERVEIFDPQTNSWTEAQSLQFSRALHTAVLLDDGRVLVIGGWSTWKDCGSFPPDGEALLYDPQIDSWTATGPMVTPRNFGASVRLPDGRVLVAGGLTYENPVPKTWASTEIYDPALNTWTAVADLAQARYTHALVLLPDGQVLAVGGARDADYLWSGDSFVREIERYDPVANAWRTVGELPEPRAQATANLLPDGRVWLTGGRNNTTYFSDTWLLGPRTPAPPAPLLVRYDFEGDFTASGTVVDRSGNGHDARVYGAVTQAAGISGGQGIAFTGNGYLQAASNPAAGKTNVTFSLWFKTAHPENNYKLASGAWWNWGPGSGWIMATHGPEFWSDDTKGLLLPGQPNIENNFPSGAWIHEVVTYDGSRIKEYTNGQLINDWSTTGAALGQGNPLVVGAWPPFTGYNFQGSMDEFAIYGRSLTQQEVQALYNQGR
jgi:N-acetylneuraminic acid mutarotase